MSDNGTEDDLGLDYGLDYGQGQGHLIQHHTPPPQPSSEFSGISSPHHQPDTPRAIPIRYSSPIAPSSPTLPILSPTTTFNTNTIAKIKNLNHTIDKLGSLTMKSTSSIPSKIDERVNDTLNEIPVLGEALIDTIEAYNEEREKLKKERKALKLEREHLLAKPSLSVTPRPIAPLRRTPTNLPPPIYPKIAMISDSGRRPGQGHMASTSDLSFRSDSAPSDPFQDLEPLTGFTELTPYKLTSEEAEEMVTDKISSDLANSRFDLEIVFCPAGFQAETTTDFLRAIQTWDDKDIKWRSKGYECCALCSTRATPGRCKPKTARDPKKPCAPCQASNGHYCTYPIAQGFLALYISKAGGSKLPYKSQYQL